MRNMLFAGLMAAALLSGPALARTDGEPASAPVQDAHADLGAALQEGVDQGAGTERFLDAMVQELIRTAPEIELLEAEKPGLTAALREAMRPVIGDYASRTRAKFAPQMAQALRDMVTAPEAAEAAAFYRTELGRKVLSRTSAPFRPDEAPDEGTAETGLSAQERSELEQAYAQTPALQKLASGGDRLEQIQAEVEKEPMTPQEETRLMEAIAATFDTHFPAPAQPVQ